MNKKDSIKSKDVEDYELLSALLNSLHDEVRTLSHKKPDAPLNKLKAGMINKTLTRILELLKNEATLEFIELLDEETLPTNSDALFVIVQFQTAMNQFKRKHYGLNDRDYLWRTSE